MDNKTIYALSTLLGKSGVAVIRISGKDALKAVELTAPFRPLPADFRGQSIDIQFTFDYNVFGGSRY